MPWPQAAAAIIGAGASLIGADRAANAQERAFRGAQRQQGVATQQQLALSQPALNTGLSALQTLSSLFGLGDPGGFGTPGTQQGLSEIPGVTWQGRPVFQDANGAIYAPRGRDASVGSSGLEFLGTPTQDARGVRFDGHYLRDSRGGRVGLDDQGLFARRGGERFEPLEAAQPETSQAPQSQSATLQSLIADNPILQFQREQGEQAISRNAAARGLNQSGGTLRDLAEFNNGLVAQGTQQFVLNPLFELAGFGQRQVGNNQNILANNAVNQGNLGVQAGQVRSSAFQNQGNTLGNLISGLPSFFNNDPGSQSPFGGVVNGRPLQGPPVG